MLRALASLALILVLVACNGNAQPVDLTPVETRLSAVENRLATLEEGQAASTSAVVSLEDAFTSGFLDLQSSVAGLTAEAVDLQTLVAAPLDLARVDLNTLSGLVVETDAPDVAILIEPGACPEDAAAPRDTVPVGTVLTSSFYQAPTGPHCVTAPAGDGLLAASVTVDVQPGAITSVSLVRHAE